VAGKEGEQKEGRREEMERSVREIQRKLDEQIQASERERSTGLDY